MFYIFSLNKAWEEKKETKANVVAKVMQVSIFKNMYFFVKSNFKFFFCFIKEIRVVLEM